MKKIKKKYINSTMLPKDTEFTADIKADPDYTAGRLNIKRGKLNKDTAVYATPAILINTVSIVVKQYDHQHIIIHIYDKKNRLIKTYKNQPVISLKPGTRWKAEVVADFGYTPGRLIGYTNRIHSLYQNRFIYADTDATPEDCFITIGPVIAKDSESYEQYKSSYSSQINLYEKDGEYVEFYNLSESKESLENTNTFTIKYGDWYGVDIVDQEGFNSIIFLDGDSGIEKCGIVDKDNPLFNKTNKTIQLYFSNGADPKKYTISIPETINQQIVLSLFQHGEWHDFTEDQVVEYGIKYRLRAEPSEGYVPGGFITPIEGIVEDDITVQIAHAIEIEKGLLEVTYVDGEKETVPLAQWMDHWWEYGDTEPYLEAFLDNYNKLDPLYIDIDTEGLESQISFVTDSNETFYNNPAHMVQSAVTRVVVQIVQSLDQTITVSYNDEEFTDSFIIPINSSITVHLKEDNDLVIKGSLMNDIPEDTPIIVLDNILIIASPVKHKIVH